MPPRAEGTSATLRVRAVPRAARNVVGPLVDDVLQVRVVRPPVDGEANLAIRRLLATELDLPLSRVRLVAGERGREKRFVLEGMTGEQLAERLRRLGAVR